MGKVKEYEEVLNNLVDEANKLEASDCFEDQVRARGMFNVINKLELARGNNVRQGVTDADRNVQTQTPEQQQQYRQELITKVMALSAEKSGVETDMRNWYYNTRDNYELRQILRNANRIVEPEHQCQCTTTIKDDCTTGLDGQYRVKLDTVGELRNTPKPSHAEKRRDLINRALEVMYRDDDPKYLKSNRDFLCTIDNEELQRRIDYHQ